MIIVCIDQGGTDSSAVATVRRVLNRYGSEVLIIESVTTITQGTASTALPDIKIYPYRPDPVFSEFVWANQTSLRYGRPKNWRWFHCHKPRKPLPPTVSRIWAHASITPLHAPVCLTERRRKKRKRLVQALLCSP